MGALMSRKQAAEKLGVSLVTLDKARQSGHLEYIQLFPGAKVWISEDALNDFLARSTHRDKPTGRVDANGTFRRRRV